MKHTKERSTLRLWTMRAARRLHSSARRTPRPISSILAKKQFKTAVDSEYLAPLDDFLAGSEAVSKDDLWENAVERFRYDSGSATTPGKAGGDATLYALPAENNPVVVYYNVNWFKDEGINIISIAENELPDGYLPHGYYEYTDANKPAGTDWVKTGDVYRVFNNQIPMNWEEVMQLRHHLHRYRG